MESYGCSASQADAEIMAGLLEKDGFKPVKSPNDSDVNIINTCIVKTPTEQKMIHRIRELSKTKKPLIVAGCLPVAYSQLVERISPNASMIGPNSVQKIIDVTRIALKSKRSVCLNDTRVSKLCFPRKRRNPIIDIIPISQGCLSNCSYCSVKLAKGKLFSYPMKEIVEEVKNAIKVGCKELWITSQDSSCYGKDIGSSLPELLDEIVKIDSKFLVRVGMMNPLHAKGMVDELIDSFKSDKIFKFLHLPVQSGSDSVLETMGRGYTVNESKNIVEKFKKEFPMLTLSTDIIVGFPSETEDDFKMTLKLMQEIKPDIVNISKFGPRPGTKAAEMNQLKLDTINRRIKQLIAAVKPIKKENKERWLNWEGEILIDEIGPSNESIGRNFAYVPIVAKGKIGTFQKIKVTECQPTYLRGVLCC